MSAVEQIAPAPVTIKEAVAQAKQFLIDLGEEPLNNMRLEEIERDREEGTWRVTLGYDRDVEPPRDPLAMSGALAGLARLSKPIVRIYKVVTVDAQSGEALAMKMRQP